MKFLVPFLLASAIALAQSNASSRGGAAVCPLSESQTQKSIDAFAKIVPTLTEEPRCVNCHGGVNPFIDGIGKDRSDPNFPPSLTDHGGGKMERGTPPSASNPNGSAGTDCSGCHNNMPAKTSLDKDGKHPESQWRIAPFFLSFLGKDATTLCKQIKDFSRGCEEGADGISTCGPWPDAKKFIAHLTNDEGNDNFTGTAFKGDRALDRTMYSESDIPSEPPKNITAPGLIALGNDWVATTGGEFKGDKDCGCEPAHYAIRVSATTELNMGRVHHKSGMPSVDVPITFEDDGTYKGEAVVNFQGATTVDMCAGQSTDTMKIGASGKAVETVEEQSMHLKLENTSPDISTASAKCSPFGGFNKQDTHLGTTVLPFDFEGDVGETLDYGMPKPVPGFNSTTHIEIVKLAEPKE